MAEPEGLNLSLDDLIKKRHQPGGQGNFRGRGGRFDGGRGRGRGRFGVDGVRGGFVQKPAGRGFGHQQQQNFQHQGGFRGGFAGRRGGYSGGFNAGRGGFVGGRGQGQFGQQQGFQQQRFQQQAPIAQQPMGWVAQQRLAQNQFNTRPQGFVQQGFPQQQQQRFVQQVQQPEEYVEEEEFYEEDQIIEEPEPEFAPPEVFVDEATGNVVARIEDTDIVTINPDGVIVLESGGWFTDDTLAGFNAVLNLIGITVEDKDGSWVVRDGARLLRYTDGMRLPHRGLMSQTRGQVVLAHFTGSGVSVNAAQLAQQASRASSAAAAALLGGRGGGMVNAGGMGRGLGGGMGGLAAAGRGGMLGTGMGVGMAGRGAGGQQMSEMQRRLMRQGRA